MTSAGPVHDRAECSGPERVEMQSENRQIRETCKGPWCVEYAQVIWWLIYIAIEFSVPRPPDRPVYFMSSTIWGGGR